MDYIIYSFLSRIIFLEELIMSLIIDLEAYIEELKHQPGNEIFKIRRKLEGIRALYLKRGNAIPVTKKFELHCKDCGSSMLREDDYYLHLRKSHNYSDQDAAIETVNPKREFEINLHTLDSLLTDYTEHYLDDGHYEIT